MANSLKLSNNLYWDSSNIIIPYQGNYYKYSDISCEVRAGTVALPTLTNAYGDRTWVAFDHPTSAPPIVVASNATDYDSWYESIISYNVGGVPTVDGFYLKRFSIRNDLASLGSKGQAASYIAVVPKIPASSYSYEEQRSYSRNILPSPASSDTSLKMTDNNFWDLSSIRDAQDTANYNLGQTFYKIVTGTTTLTINNEAYGEGKIVDIGYTFKDAPHIIVSIAKGSSGAYTWEREQGLVRVAAYSKSVLTNTGSSGTAFSGGASWDMHKQFALRGWNSSGAACTIAVNWIAIGLTQ